MRINKGEDDEMEICGYKRSLVKSCITFFFMVVSCGLIRLLFHWVPHWYLKATSVKCGFKDAETILITVSIEVYNRVNLSIHSLLFRKCTMTNIRPITLNR